MLTVDTINVRPLTVKSVEITWTIEPTDEPLNLSRFRVLRSESPEGKYVDVSGPLANTFIFLDHVNLKQKFNKVSWRIQVDHIPTGITQIFPAGTFDEAFEFHPEFARSVTPGEFGPDFISLEISRRNNLLLRRFTGKLCAYFVIKTQGQRCVVCFDNLKKRSKQSQCPECFGTTFQGGYFEQINAFIDISPSPDIVQIANFGKMQPKQSVMWMSNFPLAKPNDLIVEPTNRRWRVVSVNGATHKRYLVQQYLQVEEIDRSDAEMLLPADLDLRHPPEDFIGFFPQREDPRTVQQEGSGLL